MSKDWGDGDLPLYLQVIASNFWARHVGYGGDTDEVSAHNESCTHSVNFYTASDASESGSEAGGAHTKPATKRHQKQQSLPIFKHNSSPNARGSDCHFAGSQYPRRETEPDSLQLISDLPSSDEEGTVGIGGSPESKLSPGGRFGLSSATTRTAANSIDDRVFATPEKALFPEDLKAKALRFKYEAKIKAERALREEFGLLPTTAYCEHCRKDVSTRVSVELPQFSSWKGWCLAQDLLGCCSEPDVLPRYQDIRHYCRRCRRLLAEVTPGH